MAREFEFTDATRQGNKLRAALVGPPGSGKTWTGLEIATAIAAATGETIGVIDTERKSANLYAPPFKFKHCQFTPPYHPEDLIQALATSAQQGIGIALIDTMSRFWSGSGGMLELVDAAAPAAGKFGSGWTEMRPVENRMIEAILAYPGHIIVTMRVKTAYEVGTNSDGKLKMRKIGLKPEQRDGVEYEFDLIGEIDVEQNMVIGKSRCPELTGKTFHRPGPDVGGTIVNWLSTCAPTRTANEYRDLAMAPDATFAQVGQYFRESEKDQLHGAALLHKGQVITLKDLLVGRGNELKAREQAVSPAAAVPQPRQPVTV